MCNITLTLFRFSPLSGQIGAEQMNGSPGFRSADLSHTKRWPGMPKPWSRPTYLFGSKPSSGHWYFNSLYQFDDFSGTMLFKASFNNSQWRSIIHFWIIHNFFMLKCVPRPRGLYLTLRVNSTWLTLQKITSKTNYTEILWRSVRWSA